MDNRQISLCLTSWQRYTETLEAFVQVANDDRISEIVICDDNSDIEIYNQLERAVSFCPKVKLYRNLINYDCYANKAHVVGLANNEWLIQFDSDNTMTTDYLDKIFSIEKWEEDTIYQPSWAQPLFDFRAYSGMVFTKHNIAEYLDKPMVSTLLNAMNYFVNRNRYLEVWQPLVNPHTADSILQNYNHLKADGKIFVVPELFYHHKVHDGSHYKKNVHLTGNLYEQIEKQLRQLK